MTRIGIFGGSFNPPHLCHLLNVELVLASGLVDRVLIVPCGHHPFEKELLDYELRFEMCEMAFSGFCDRVEISKVEDKSDTCYTIDSLKLLEKQYPDAEFRLIIGSDNLSSLPQWKDSAEVLRLAKTIVVGRQGFEKDIVDIPIFLPNVASSSIRVRIESGDSSALRLLPKTVADFIKSKGLYTDPLAE